MYINILGDNIKTDPKDIFLAYVNLFFLLKCKIKLLAVVDTVRNIRAP
jgi:hypothetical protein